MLAQPVPAPPAPPAPPALPAIPTPGVRVYTGDATTPQAIYAAARARGQELARQLERLEDRREELSQRLQQVGDEVDRKGLQAQITEVDGRIAGLNAQIAESDQQIAQAAGIPGAIVERPEPPRRDGPPEAFIAIPALFVLFVLFPLALAWARRIWRRSSLPAAAPIPAELTQRIERIETAVEAVAVEVERIGEGQRFVTKMFAESPARAQVEAPR